MAEPDSEPSFDDRFLNNLPDYVTATPVEGDPFERAAQRVRAPYEKANQRESGIPDVLSVFGNRIKSGLTAPLDALTGKLQVNDPETGMPTQEAIGRSMDVAGLAGSGGIGGAESGSVLGSGPFKQGWESAGLKEKPVSWDRVKPAIRDPETGELFVGSRRDTHEHVLARQYEKETGEISGEDRESINKLYDWDKKRKFEDGYYDFKDQKFHNRSDPNSEYYGVDSTSFNPRKAMRADQVWSDTQKPAMLMSSIMNENKAPPFYSALEHAVENTKQQKMPADQWLGTISNSKGVKPEELDWTGFKDFLTEKGKQPVTKAEVQEHLNNNKVELKEVNKGNEGSKVRLPYNRDEEGNIIDTSGDTKYSQYQLPGGENYREMLMTMPEKNEARWRQLDNMAVKTPEQRQEYLDLSNKLSSKPEYKSSHWDEPNILAHVRMNDRNIEGKKSLHLEEIQSDWHQQGREKGYKSQKTDADIDKELSEFAQRFRITRPEELARARQSIIDQGVPDAPFKKTWHELALKRMVREAAEKGYDRLSWTPGEANRTNPKNLGQTGESAERADRGLKKFYDEIIPQSLEKIGKEHGVKVKTAETETNPKGWKITPPSETVSGKWMVKSNDYNSKGFHFNTKEEAEANLKQQIEGERTPKQKLHYIDIPESLKNVATQKGFPLFSSGLPVTFTPVDGDPHKSANTVGDAIDTAAKKYGINPTVLKGIASIESSWDPGSNRNKATQYKGLFQIGKEEWKQHGSGDIYNAKDNANAAAKMLSEHAQWFKDNYGREPTPGEFYMMHQQGRGFISNGTMTNIGGNPYPGMRGPQTPETFKQGWSDTLARKMAQFGDADSISDGTERAPSSNVKVASNSPTPTHKFTPVDFNPFDLVNHANHVPYGAGASDTPSGYPVNIDKRIPQHNDELKLPDGEPADLHKYLTIHEIEEYKAMKNGVPYHTAHHDIATPMEKKAVESDGVDWKKYTHIMDGYLKKTEEEGYKNLPKGLYAKPYHSRSLIKPEPKKDNEK